MWSFRTTNILIKFEYIFFFFLNLYLYRMFKEGRGQRSQVSKISRPVSEWTWMEAWGSENENSLSLCHLFFDLLNSESWFFFFFLQLVMFKITWLLVPWICPCCFYLPFSSRYSNLSTSPTPPSIPPCPHPSPMKSPRSLPGKLHYFEWALESD